MPGTPSRYPMALGFRKGHDTGEQGQNNEMGVTVLIMEPILRFLQLLCENHNRDLQVGHGADGLRVRAGVTGVTETSLDRTSSGARTTKPTTTWCARRCSSSTSCAAAPRGGWGCWGSTSTSATWRSSPRRWRPSPSTARGPATRTRSAGTAAGCPEHFSPYQGHPRRELGWVGNQWGVGAEHAVGGC